MSRTLLIVKPDATERNLIGHVVSRLEKARYKIVEMRMVRLTEEQARKFYAVHEGKPFLDDLVKFMTSGPVVPMVLEKENAVEDFRTLIGATNPEEAAEGTIRKLFADSMSENAVHGSDSDENAAIEGVFHFSGREVF